MKVATLEWITKAEGDWTSAGREFRARKAPNYNDTCYHCQQCAEKYLKARLQEASAAVPKTHDLPALLALVLPVDAAWTILQPALLKLDDYNTDFRYPGRDATKADAQQAYRFCRRVREVAQRSFGLPV